MNPINALNLTRPKPDQHPIAEQIIREGFERGRREVGTVQVPATIDYRVVLNDLRARKARLAEFSEQLDGHRRHRPHRWRMKNAATWRRIRAMINYRCEWIPDPDPSPEAQALHRQRRWNGILATLFLAACFVLLL